MVKKEKSTHYVDNKILVQEIEKYKKACKAHKGDGRPQMRDELGVMILLIAEGLAQKPNFSNYTFKEDMIYDGVENCIQYIKNFDTKKSTNAFAYVTQIIYYAFLRRIAKEKKQHMVKYKAFEAAGISGLYQALQHKTDLHPTDPYQKFLQHLQISVNDIEEDRQPTETKKTTKKKKRKSKKKLTTDRSVEDFMSLGDE